MAINCTFYRIYHPYSQNEPTGDDQTRDWPLGSQRFTRPGCSTKRQPEGSEKKTRFRVSVDFFRISFFFDLVSLRSRIIDVRASGWGVLFHRSQMDSKVSSSETLLQFSLAWRYCTFRKRERERKTSSSSSSYLLTFPVHPHGIDPMT